MLPETSHQLTDTLLIFNISETTYVFMALFVCCIGLCSDCRRAIAVGTYPIHVVGLTQLLRGHMRTSSEYRVHCHNSRISIQTRRFVFH